MPCSKFGWKCPSGSGEEDFKKFNDVFLLFLQLIPLWEGRDPSFEKNNRIIFTQGCFVPSLLENDPVVLEKKIFKTSQWIFTISQLSPLWEGCGPSLEQIWISFTQECFVPSLFEVGPVVLEKKILKVFNVFLLFPNYLPLKKGVALHAKNFFSFQPRMLCAKFGWN